MFLSIILSVFGFADRPKLVQFASGQHWAQFPLHHFLFLFHVLLLLACFVWFLLFLFFPGFLWFNVCLPAWLGGSESVFKVNRIQLRLFGCLPRAFFSPLILIFGIRISSCHLCVLLLILLLSRSAAWCFLLHSFDFLTFFLFSFESAFYKSSGQQY